MRPELFRLFDVGVPVVLRPAALGLPLRHRDGRDLGAAHRAEPRRHRRPRARDAPRRRRGRAPAPRLRRRLLLGLRPPLHRTRASSTGTSPARSASRAAYDGVWDAAKGVCHPKETDCFAWAKFWAGGLTYYGGFIGASVAAWYLLRRDRFPFWKAADMAAFAVPLGLAFGRMGCLLAGCCFGAECELPWALSFPPQSPASEEQFKAHALATKAAWSHPVHPTQIYESAASLAIAAVCLFLVQPQKALRRPGLRGVPRALRGRALPPRDPPAGRPGRAPRALHVAAHRHRARRDAPRPSHYVARRRPGRAVQFPRPS